MYHPLENPAWNALNSGNKHLSNGDENVKYFDLEVSPFAGFSQHSTENFSRLYKKLPGNRPVLYVATKEITIPSPWRLMNHIKGFQMVYNNDALTSNTTAIKPLSADHVLQMVALAKLTQPGPFGMRTIEFGHYHGIFNGDNLVAMAGQRLLCGNYAEISAVCTHPDHIGKGYARHLLIHQAERIINEGNTPFLHVRYDNDRAVSVYKDLGFETRTAVHFYVFQK